MKFIMHLLEPWPNHQDRTSNSINDIVMIYSHVLGSENWTPVTPLHSIHMSRLKDNIYKDAGS